MTNPQTTMVENCFCCPADHADHSFLVWIRFAHLAGRKPARVGVRTAVDSRRQQAPLLLRDGCPANRLRSLAGKEDPFRCVSERRHCHSLAKPIRGETGESLADRSVFPQDREIPNNEKPVCDLLAHRRRELSIGDWVLGVAESGRQGRRFGDGERSHWDSVAAGRRGPTVT